MSNNRVVGGVLLLALLVVTTVADGNFDSFKVLHGRKYANAEEELYRQNTYRINLDAIKRHNSNPDRAYSVGENQFTDLRKDEFKSKCFLKLELVLMPNRGAGRRGTVSNVPAVESTVPTASASASAIATSIDWSTKGKVSRVKDQGQCGSCWAFAAVAMLESSILFKNSTTIPLSEQYLVDCCRPAVYFSARKCPWTNGCDGGWSEDALELVALKGIPKQSSYPYVAYTNACKTSVPRFKVISTPYTNVTVGSVRALKTAVNSRTVGVGIYADGWSSY